MLFWWHIFIINAEHVSILDLYFGLEGGKSFSLEYVRCSEEVLVYGKSSAFLEYLEI